MTTPWGSKKFARDARPRKISFIFMQLSAKLLPNNRLAPPTSSGSANAALNGILKSYNKPFKPFILKKHMSSQSYKFLNICYQPRTVT